MNKIKIEANNDGTYVVTMPGGGQRICSSPADVASRLAHEEQEYQNTINDIRSRKQEYEAKAAKP
jgi:hypothetical protein